MGDNRDDSLDSRFSPQEGGIGFVPVENLIGRATFIFWSTDGTADYAKPWTWFTALREARIATGFNGRASERPSRFRFDTLGHDPRRTCRCSSALTHSSVGKDSYERLEFLGDRVVGLVIARCSTNGSRRSRRELSRRYNVLVVARDLRRDRARARPAGADHDGKQAREDGANQSDNVVGDVVEAP